MNRWEIFNSKHLCGCQNDFIEPVGSVSPKLTTGDKTRNIDIRRKQNITLLCPAQAYPVPVFRYVEFLKESTLIEAKIS